MKKVIPSKLINKIDRIVTNTYTYDIVEGFRFGYYYPVVSMVGIPMGIRKLSDAIAVERGLE